MYSTKEKGTVTEKMFLQDTQPSVSILSSWRSMFYSSVSGFRRYIKALERPIKNLRQKSGAGTFPEGASMLMETESMMMNL